ncbi:YcjF family protein [Thorsellia anophelis]|uniref:Putative membrane protein n=1 Tax=Thorsellia anophelis DSM 18579 TaxID=1123402 RepID=A0A1H9ZY58_9GAMM|nr:TIGR01620 family protein [Thorsellia anophelis]SES86323.1 putative membrane protein [Thorsellia anophelis DSM 18579]
MVNSTNTTQSPIRPAQFFQSDEQIIIEPLPNSDMALNELEIKAEPDLFVPKKQSFAKRLFAIACLLFVIAATVQSGYHIYSQWLSKAWLSMLIDISLLGIGLAVLSSIINEYFTLKKLKQSLNLQARGCELFESMEVNDEAKDFCLSIVKKNGLGEMNHESLSPSVKYWLSQINETHTNQEVITLFEQSVMITLDKKAMKVIESHMTDSALLVALSPLAIVDMLFVAWRNLRMVNQIAAIYGIELNYFGRIRLLKHILFNVAFVGGAELITELGSELLSQDILAKFSTRAAQGIGAGVLTARLGIQTIKLCRPIPFIQSAPKLSHLRLNLINKVKNMIKTAR